MSSYVDLVGFTHAVAVNLFNLTTDVLYFVDKVENCLIVPIKITSGLGGPLRSYLLDNVEHFFETEAILPNIVSIRSLRYVSQFSRQY